MGTPSGSKNQNLFMDRLFGKDVRSFDGGAYMGPGAQGADMGYYATKEKERQLEKAQRHEELQEFKLAASEHRIERTLTKIDKVSQQAVPAAGPSALSAKRKVPTFLKLKSKEDAFDDKDLKRLRTEEAAEESGGAASPVAESSPPSQTPGQASLLGGYESSDEDDDEAHQDGE
eukprot:TRINITY_DN111868_c0_g1_i1.p1 TRINITY_DN111868_c0_g1~~TRINITY_DN111868_c0_g1_i1.p1  ORF type:complete len:174 (+),score=52.31 TRINITY_DN111868_c0_g1_i1:84-605(+)